MIYSKQELEQLATTEEKAVAHKRYLHKVIRSDTKKLLPHEQEYICTFLPRVYADSDLTQPLFDVYNLSFCAEPLFKQLFLTYMHCLDFVKPVWNGIKYLEPYEIEKDRRKFEELLTAWNKKLSPDYSDCYLHEVKIEYERKLKILKDQYKQRYFGRFLYERKIIEQMLNAFYIYFLTKIFFRSHKSNSVSFIAFSVTFSCNIYSYIHIMSRHYMPHLNSINEERSFNEELCNIDPRNLPYSIRALIIDYFNNAPINYVLNAEYMIFGQDASFYILWWKYKKLDELNHVPGYEIRTLYKIEAERDKQKISHNNFYTVNDRITYYY